MVPNKKIGDPECLDILAATLIVIYEGGNFNDPQNSDITQRGAEHVHLNGLVETSVIIDMNRPGFCRGSNL